MNKYIASFSAALVCSSAVFAASRTYMKLTAVPANTPWLIQGQMKEFNNWSAFPKIYESLNSTGWGQSLQAAARAFNRDEHSITTDVERVTVFGVDTTNLIVMLEGNWKGAQISQALESNARMLDHPTTTLKIYAIPVGQNSIPLHAVVTGDQIWLGESSQVTARVASQLSRNQPITPAFQKFARQAAGSEGAMLSLLSQDSRALASMIPELAVLMQADGLALHLHNLKGTEMLLNIVADTANPEAATNLLQMFSGLQMMAAFRGASDPLWNRLAQSIKMRQEGDKVIADIAADDHFVETLLKTGFREVQRKGGW